MVFLDHLKTLVVGSDHAGFELKQHLKKSLPQLPWQDEGTFNTESVDYPDFADKVCALVNPPMVAGVLICGSGQGMAIRANRHKHIRAALCWHEEIARLARAHNDANVLCLGARTMDYKVCVQVLNTFLTTGFEGGRHAGRVDKLSVSPRQ
ncbi:MAG: ribose 5-phosphate isomerase B [Bdellovibrionales bacterium]